MSWTSGPIGVGLLRLEFDFDDSRSNSDRARTPKNNFKNPWFVSNLIPIKTFEPQILRQKSCIVSI